MEGFSADSAALFVERLSPVSDRLAAGPGPGARGFSRQRV